MENLKIKVIQINSVIKSGSTGKIMLDICKELINADNSCLMIYGRGRDLKLDYSFKISSNFDNRIHGIETRIFDKHGYRSVRATRKLISKILEYKPDIIHLHNLHGYYLNIKLLFNFLADYDKPIVWTLHDCWSLTGHCAHFNNVGCMKWKSKCHNCVQKTRYPASYFIDNSLNNYQLKKECFTSINNMTVTVPSKWMESVVKESYLKKYPLRVINNGIDIELFKPQMSSNLKEKYNLNYEFIILGVASVWDENKGLNDFIELSKLIDSDSAIILVGLTDKQKIFLPPNIIGINRTENINELVEFYSLSNVFINPSKEETFGLTTIEAMACGTPIIVYNNTASPELVCEKCGYVVETGNVNNVMQSIKIIRANGKEHYTHNCRKHIVNTFDKSEKCLEYINLYKHIIDKKDED